MKLHDPPALALALSALSAIVFWLLGARMAIVAGTAACGILYFIFYLVVQPRRD
jgi:hypothetical protein